MRPSLVCALLLAFVVSVAVPSAHAQRTEADVYVAQAIVDFEQKNYADATANLQKALAIEPNHVEALYYMGVVLMAQGRHADAVPFLERARARSPNDPVIVLQLGLAFFGDQRYDRAQPLLEEVFRRDPTLNSAGYYVGFLRYRNKDYRGALAAFRAGRASDPEIQQLTRFYSGLALGILGLPTEAAAEIDQALRLLPGSALTGPAERIRDSMLAARPRERRLSAEVRVGVIYDDNVAVIPTRDSAEPLVAVLRQPKHESTGELLGVRVGYVWLEHEGWASSIGYSFFGTYNNEVTKFNITDHLVNLDVTKTTTIRDMQFQAAAQYAYDVLFLGGDEFIQRNTVTVSGTLAESPRHLTQVFARYQNKQFNETVDTLRDEIRDGHNYTIGATHVLRFASDRHFLKAGYQFDYEDTEGVNYRYFGHRLLAGGQYTLPWWDIRLRDDVDVHFRGYRNKNTILPTPAPSTKWRHDQEVTNVARIEVPLRARFTVSAEYQADLNASNIEVFDYKRNVFSLILTWTY